MGFISGRLHKLEDAWINPCSWVRNSEAGIHHEREEKMSYFIDTVMTDIISASFFLPRFRIPLKQYIRTSPFDSSSGPDFIAVKSDIYSRRRTVWASAVFNTAINNLVTPRRVNSIRGDRSKGEIFPGLGEEHHPRPLSQHQSNVRISHQKLRRSDERRVLWFITREDDPSCGWAHSSHLIGSERRNVSRRFKLVVHTDALHKSQTPQTLFCCWGYIRVSFSKIQQSKSINLSMHFHQASHSM